MEQKAKNRPTSHAFQLGLQSFTFYLKAVPGMLLGTPFRMKLGEPSVATQIQKIPAAPV